MFDLVVIKPVVLNMGSYTVLNGNSFPEEPEQNHQSGRVYLLALLQEEDELHADRGNSSPLGPMKAAVGQKDPQQGLVLPQPGLASFRVLLLRLEATPLHLVPLISSGLRLLQKFIWDVH